LKWLVDQPLYKNEEIVISNNWLNVETNSQEGFIIEEDDCDLFDKSDMTSLDNDFNNNVYVKSDVNPLDYDSDSSEEDIETDSDEDDVTVNDKSQETLLLQEGIILAPGEGLAPVSIFSDNCEELCFPTIYAGQPFNDGNPKKLSATELDKYKIRYYDRRFCKIPSLLFLLRHKQIFNLRQQLKTVLKMGKFKDKNLTVEDVRDNSVIDSIIRSDDGFKILSNDRSSPQYWSKRLKDIMAMIRQLGKSI
jgi:hypothetical protein